MSQFAEIVGSTVARIIVADAAFIATQPGVWVECTPERGGVAVGSAYDATTGTFVQSPTPDPKVEAWERIKAERDRRQSDGGVLVGGKWFKSSDQEVGRYNSIITVATKLGLPATAVIRSAWRTMQDGVTEDMTANLAESILTAGFMQFAAIDDASKMHKAAMEASASPSTYDFSSGWPDAFPLFK